MSTQPYPIKVMSASSSAPLLLDLTPLPGWGCQLLQILEKKPMILDVAPKSQGSFPHGGRPKTSLLEGSFQDTAADAEQLCRNLLLLPSLAQSSRPACRSTICRLRPPSPLPPSSPEAPPSPSHAGTLMFPHRGAWSDLGSVCCHPAGFFDDNFKKVFFFFFSL